MCQYERLIQYVNEHYGKSSNNDIADKLGVSKSTFSNWASRGISKNGLELINKAYGAQAVQFILEGSLVAKRGIMDELREKIRDIESKGADELDGIAFFSPGTIPVISWVAAGSWSETMPVTMDNVIEELPRPPNIPDRVFALQVRGESMLPKFSPGDYIYVNPNVGFFDLKNGDLVVVQEADKHETTFKQLVIGETSEEMYLRPLNPDWPEQKMLPKSQWELVGKVIGKWVKY